MENTYSFVRSSVRLVVIYSLNHTHIHSPVHYSCMNTSVHFCFISDLFTHVYIRFIFYYLSYGIGVHSNGEVQYFVSYLFNLQFNIMFFRGKPTGDCRKSTQFLSVDKCFVQCYNVLCGGARMHTRMQLITDIIYLRKLLVLINPGTTVYWF